jgi:CRP-like cAMP-binding protein
MTQKVATRELEKQLRKEPDNLALRLRLAASYREAGRAADAVQLYRSVAIAYHAQRRLAQAAAVCRSVLDIEPGQRETVALLAELEAMQVSGSYVPEEGTGTYRAVAPSPELRAEEARIAEARTGQTPPPRPITGQTPLVPRSQTAETRTVPRPPTGEMRTVPKPVTGQTPLVPRPTSGPLASEPSSPGMPAVRMLDQDVSVRELTPVRSLARPAGPQTPLRSRPSTGPRRAASPLVTPGGGPPPSPTPPPRSSAPEDTPLPRPVPFHEVGEDSMAYMVPLTPQAPPASSAHVAPPPMPPPKAARLRDLPEGTTPPAPRREVDPTAAGRAAELRTRAVAPTLPAPTGEPRMPLPAEPRPPAAPTAIGKEPSGRVRRDETFGEEHATHVAHVEPRRTGPQRLPTPHPDDDDAVTHVSGDWPIETRRGGEAHRAPTRPAMALPAAPTSAMDMASDLDTRRLPRLSARDIELLSRGRGSEPGRSEMLDEEPTHPPTNPMALTPPPVHPSALQAIGAPLPGLPDAVVATGPSSPDLDDAVPQAMPPDLQQFARGPRLMDVEAQWGEEITDARATQPPVTDPQAMHPGPLFDRPFAETLQGLGPDGSAIEAPTTGLLGVFSTMPADVVVELERQMIVRHVVPGETILREGDRGDSCFVIGAGEVRVLKSDPLGTDTPRAEPIEVARLGDGALFGEFALLADRRRHATVEAVTACELYEIPRRLLRELAAGHAEVGPALERFYRERLLSTLLTTAPFFKPLPEDRRAELLARFSPIHADAGQAIVREGESAGGFYLIVLGAVDIVRSQSERRPVLLATLREGAYFGEMSLMSGHEASASVIAAGPVELAFLPPKAFYDIVSAHPKLWAAMRAEVRHRELENARIVAGDSSAS